MTWRGGRHGKAAPAIPPWDTEQLPPALEELRQAGSNDIDLIGLRWAKLDERLTQAWKDAHFQYHRALKALDRAKRDYRAARDDYASIHGGRAPKDDDRKRFWYKTTTVVLFISEFPLSLVAFRLLGESELLTMVAAAVIGFILLLCAHFLGESFRQVSGWAWKDVFMIAFLVTVPTGVILAVAYLRGVFMMGSAQLGPVQLDPDSVRLSFIAFNAGLFLAATIASYRIHPRGLLEVHKTRRRLDLVRKRTEALERALNKARSRREGVFESLHAEALRLQETVDLLAERYRDANYFHRTDRGKYETKYPPWFSTPLEIEWPDSLKDIEWSVEHNFEEETSPVVNPNIETDLAGSDLAGAAQPSV